MDDNVRSVVPSYRCFGGSFRKLRAPDSTTVPFYCPFAFSPFKSVSVRPPSTPNHFHQLLKILLLSTTFSALSLYYFLLPPLNLCYLKGNVLIPLREKELFYSVWEKRNYFIPLLRKELFYPVGKKGTISSPPEKSLYSSDGNTPEHSHKKTDRDFLFILQ